jgi:hypothetical protein
MAQDQPWDGRRGLRRGIFAGCTDSLRHCTERASLVLMPLAHPCPGVCCVALITSYWVADLLASHCTYYLDM